MNCKQRQNEADNLRKAGEYKEALLIYESLWVHHRDKCDEWVPWGYAYCLRKIGQTKEALDACRQAYQLNGKNNIVTNLYAWCIFDTEIKGKEKFVEQDLERAVLGIEQLVDVKDKFSPYVSAVFKLVELLEEQGKVQRMLQWTAKLKPQDLSTETSSFTRKDGKTVKVSSHREKWYSLHTKALLENEQFDECIRVSQEALQAFPEFHYDNDVWFKWRIALSKKAKGEKSVALSMLNELLPKKKESFVFYEIARLEYELKNVEKAYELVIKGAMAPGSPEFKGNIYLLLGQIVQSKGDQSTAALHGQLAMKVRLEKDWKISDDLRKDLTSLGASEGDHRSSEELERILLGYWRKQMKALTPELKGTVKTLLPNGNAGFVRGEDGKEYHFRMKDVKGDSKKIAPGITVTFALEDGFNKKKGVSTKVAVSVRPIAE